MTLPVIVSAAVGLFAVWAIYTYNFFVHARTKVREGMSGVDVQLRLRHDLVPNLNEVVRAYAEHERELMRAAAAHRSRAIAADRPEDVESAENALAEDLSRLIAVAEEYPQLKAAATFDRPGKVINIASIDGLRINPWQTYSYQASKAAVIHLTRRLAAELVKDNILVSGIAPGAFQSDMNKAARDHAEAVRRRRPDRRCAHGPTVGDPRLGRAGGGARGAVHPVDRRRGAED